MFRLFLGPGKVELAGHSLSSAHQMPMFETVMCQPGKEPALAVSQATPGEEKIHVGTFASSRHVGWTSGP